MSGRLLIAVKDDSDGALFAGHDDLFGELHEGTVAGRGGIENDGRHPASIGEGKIVLSARIGDRDMAEVMQRLLFTEALLVHQPKFVPSYARIFPADIIDELHDKGLQGQTFHQMVFMLVIGLLAHTK